MSNDVVRTGDCPLAEYNEQLDEHALSVIQRAGSYDEFCSLLSGRFPDREHFNSFASKILYPCSIQVKAFFQMAGLDFTPPKWYETLTELQRKPFGERPNALLTDDTLVALEKQSQMHQVAHRIGNDRGVDTFDTDPVVFDGFQTDSVKKEIIFLTAQECMTVLNMSFSGDIYP